MKVEIIKDQKAIEPYAHIYASVVDESIHKAVSMLESHGLDIIVYKEGRKYLLKPNDVYLVQTLQGKLIVYSKDDTYSSNKKLYEFYELLTQDMIQISKGSLINTRYIKSVEVSFSGSLSVQMKNDLHDFIARRYVKSFKSHIGV